MLYSVNLLSIKDGKFGVVWLLGSTSKDKKVKRRQIESVVARRTCKDILELMPVSKHHASLVMASTLMLGVIKCHFYQIEFFKKDIISARQHRKRFMVATIDLPTIDATANHIMAILEEEAAHDNEDRGGVSPSTGLVLRRHLVDAQMITLNEFDRILQLQEEEGFGAVHDPDFNSDDLFAGYLAEPDTTVQKPPHPDEDGDAPGAPARRTRSQHDAAQDLAATAMDVDEQQGEQEADRPHVPPFDLQTIMSSELGMPEAAEAMPAADAEQDLDLAEQNVDQEITPVHQVGVDNLPDVGAVELQADEPQQGEVQGSPVPSSPLATGPREAPEVGRAVRRKKPIVRGGAKRRRLINDPVTELTTAAMQANFLEPIVAIDRSKLTLAHPDNPLVRFMRKPLSAHLGQDFHRIAGSLDSFGETDSNPDEDEDRGGDESHLRVISADPAQASTAADLTRGASAIERQINNDMEEMAVDAADDMVVGQVGDIVIEDVDAARQDESDLPEMMPPPQSESTMAEETDFIFPFGGCVDQEKAKLLADVMAAEGAEVDFLHYLNQDGPLGRRQVAVMFSALLNLEAEGKVVSEQVEEYGPIYVRAI